MSSVCQAEDNGRAKTEMLDDEQQFGQPSTVWMYRQATQMRSTEVSFVTNHHVDRVNYPGSEIAVHEYPYATLKPTVIPRVVRQQSRVLGGSRHSFLPNPREEQWLHKLITQTPPAVVKSHFQLKRAQALWVVSARHRELFDAKFRLDCVAEHRQIAVASDAAQSRFNVEQCCSHPAVPLR